MSFYKQSPAMASLLRELIENLESESRPDLHENISITWICYKDQNPQQFSGIGAGFDPYNKSML